METIKVNMSPNPLDVQTIHASQNDGEARQWEFELHNNGELIDTSDVKEQLVFKAYKGGTEQLLPENGSTPATSPFIGDIRYPQGLLTDQEFLYRQSPTEEDGYAKISSIKGNTLVWNQIQPNNSSRTTSGITFTYDNGKLTVSGTATATTWWLYAGLPTMLFKAGHKYLVSIGNVDDTSLNTYGWYLPLSGHRFNSSKTIITINSDVEQYLQLQVNNGYTINKIFYPQIFDLTQMFGVGNEPSTVEDFTSLFNLPYYDYNQGSLLSFNGNGIKTVGKNRLNYDVWKTVETRNGISVWENNGVTITATSNDAYTLYGASTFPVNARIPVRYGETITLSWESDDNVSGDVYIFPNGGSGGFVFINNLTGKSLSYTPVSEVEYVTIRFGVTSSGNTIHFKNIMIRYDGTDSAYEPYKESTLSLPISTYFPNGMASAKNANNNTIVYDELTPNKAIKRLEQYTFTGNETISGITNLGTYYRCYLSLPIPSKGTYATRWEKNVPNVYNYTDDSSHYYVQNSQFWYFTTSSTAQAIRDELSGTKFYYDIATPTETSFTTASFVTENAEIPLSNEDGVLIGKCTEELSENPGFIDAKIKLSDSDGECYSNKLQLHVERSPQ